MITHSPAIPGRRPVPRQIHVGIALAAMAVALTCVLLAIAITNYVRHGDGIGGDFLTDYAGGRLVRTGDGWLLYDLDTQERVQREVSPAGSADDVNPFVAPPLVAFAFAPISALPYRMAHVVFTALNLAALAGAVVLLKRELAGVEPRLRNTLLLAFAFSMPAVTDISWGQIDLVIVYAALLGWRCLTADREVLAGVAFSLLAFKPHFALGIILLLAVQRRWTALATLGAIAVPLLALPALLLGPEALRDYLGLITGATKLPAYIDTQPQHMANWRGLVTGLVGRDEPLLWMPGAAIIVLAALALAARASKREPFSARAYALAIMLPLLVSPHVHMQSMMVLFVSIGLLVKHGGVRDLALPRGWRLDGAAVLLYLLAALFVGWFLTANDISVMVLITGAGFAWVATTPLATVAISVQDRPLARAA
ncbi:MAG: DUF2029 domain-containing protein [Chloroflexi bacterium]|nr:DUF2029 domain-containing protein [Chloroflexota bacterium]